jgi:putative endonuclease
VRVQLPPGALSDQQIAFFMFFFVYIIYSESLERFYTGTTDNVHKRIEEHNSNKYPSTFTSKGIPWNLFLTIKCDSSGQAYKLERFIKKMHSSHSG